MRVCVSSTPYDSIPYDIYAANTFFIVYSICRMRGKVKALIMGNQGLRMRIYIPQKTTITVQNRLHSRQQPCRLRGELRASRSLQVTQQTVIGIGLRELFCQKVRLPFSEVRHYRKCRFSKMPHSCAKAHTYINKFAEQTCT